MDRETMLENIKYISEFSGDNEEIMNKLKEINDFVKKSLDDLDRAKEETSAYKQEEVMDTDGISWKDKYIDMKNKYRDRFFNAGDTAFINEVEKRTDDTDKFVDERKETTIEDLFGKDDE